MSIGMSPQEIEEFLSQGNIARIATVKPDNSPHVTPVWYLWENNQLLIAIPKDSVKARNIRQNNNVAVTIDTDKAPSKAVIIEGTARIEELGDEITRKIDRRMAAKYVKPEYLDEYIEWDSAQGVEYIYIRIYPEKIISWDGSKIPIAPKFYRA
ncbi:MAG: PPOX class F420-dependent oxidoreductase [Candidatus Bathyarchaeota archaeon]